MTAIAVPSPANAEAVQPGRWDVTSTIVDLSVPGVPAFLQKMAHGHTTAEHKQVAAGQGIEALLAPDPKARCTVIDQKIGDGRYAQSLACPQKRGEPLHITRAGTYGVSGFAGQAMVAGTTPKGALHIVLDQHTVRSGD